MFKFNFNIDDNKEETENGKDANTNANSSTSDGVQWYDAKEIEPSLENFDLLEMYRLNAKEIKVGNVLLHYMIPKFVLESKVDDNEDDIKRAEDNHTDLIPGVYEGGAKLWECTLDLLDYFKETNIEWPQKKVLDLGCGCGLLGIYALKNSAVVHFQDYNEDVLKNITIPNVLLNMDMDEELSSASEAIEKTRKKAKFYAGDWSNYTDLNLNEELFDYILTSETIYNPQNQAKLLNCFAAKLSKNGKIYVAAKTYYFGVGGNLKQFEDLIKTDNRFSFKNVWTSKDGVQREILQLELIEKS